MIVRSKPTAGLVRRRLRDRAGGAAGHGAVRESTIAQARERRGGGLSEDRALYSCSCGLAFDALVSTSVDCPHCGRTQAW